MTPSLPPSSGGPVARFIAIGAVLAMAAIVVYVLVNNWANSHDGPSSVFDPTTTNPEELRRVTEAVSHIIAATCPSSTSWRFKRSSLSGSRARARATSRTRA